MKVVLCPVFWENNVKKIVLNQVQAADCDRQSRLKGTKAEKRLRVERKIAEKIRTEKQTARTSTERRLRGTGAGERLMCRRKTGEQATFFKSSGKNALFKGKIKFYVLSSNRLGEGFFLRYGLQVIILRK